MNARDSGRAGSERLAVIVGASAGIGRALAVRLAGSGWRVVVASRRLEACEAVIREHPQVAARLEAHAIDVTDAPGFRRALADIEQRLGGIDTLVLNAGDYEPMPLSRFDPDLFRRLMEVNYLGAVNGIAAALPLMQPRAGGQILVTASLSAYRGLPRAAPYGASKAAVLNMVESLKPEADRLGVRLRVIDPGFVRSRLTDKNDFAMPQLIDAETAAGYVVREIDGSHFEIFFPKRFGWVMKCLRLLPYRLYFAITRRMLSA